MRGGRRGGRTRLVVILDCVFKEFWDGSCASWGLDTLRCALQVIHRLPSNGCSLNNSGGGTNDVLPSLNFRADASQKRSWANGEKSQHDYMGSKTRTAAVSETG